MTHVLKSALAAAVIGLLGVGTGPANATSSVCDAIAGNLVSNCGFEVGGGGADGDSTPADWTFSSTAATTNSNVAGVPNSGQNSYGFGASSPGFDTISQTLTTTSGQGYLFSFYVAGDTTAGPSNEFQAEWDGGSPLLDLINDVTSGYVQYTFAVTGTGSDTISFNGYDNPGYIYLDDVSVTVATPEPATLALLSVGLAGLGALRRRRR